MSRTKLTSTIVDMGVTGISSNYKEDGVLKSTTATFNVTETPEIKLTLTQNPNESRADVAATVNSISFNKIVDRPTTLAGYGITDASANVTTKTLGLDKVENTADMDKPVSTATQSALNLKADASSTYTKTEVDTAIQNTAGVSPQVINTLNTIQTQLASDETATGALITGLATKAPLNNPTFSGTVSGITAAMVGLDKVENTADIDKPVSTAVQTLLDVKANAADVFTQTETQTQIQTAIANQMSSSNDLITSLTTEVSKRASLESPAFIGTVTGISKAMVDLGNVDNTADIDKPVSTATQAALDLKANTGDYYTKTDVDSRIQSVVGAAPAALDTLKEIADQLATDEGLVGSLTTAISNKASLESPVFTGTVQGITAAMVGLVNINDTADTAKPVSVAQQAALDLKANTADVYTKSESDARIQAVIGTAPEALDTLKEIADRITADESVVGALTTSIADKAPLNNPTFTGVVQGVTADMVGLGLVSNLIDADRPISTATQTALDLKSDLANTYTKSEVDTAIAASATPAVNLEPVQTAVALLGTNVQNIQNVLVSKADQSNTYTKAEADAMIQSVIGAAPAALNTLVEIAAQLTADETALSTLVTTVGTKANASDVYTKAETVTQIQNVVNAAPAAVAALNEISNQLSNNTDAVTSMINVLATKAGVSAITDINATLATKANASDVYVKSEVDSRIQAIVGAAPAALDTLAEIAAQLAVDESTGGSAAILNSLATKAPLNSPTFTGTVTGVTKAMVGLGNVDNTADNAKPVSGPQQTALNTKANVANPTFTGTVSGISKGMVGLGNVDNTADINKPVSIAQAYSLATKAPLNNPNFTGIVSGISKGMVGLGNVDNTADISKPISNAQQAALNLKANSTNPIFSGVVSGISKGMVGLGNVDNTSDVNKPVSTLQQAALNTKANTANPSFTGTVSGISKGMVGLGNVDNTADMVKPVSTAQQAALNLKADQANTYTKTETDSRIQAIVGAAPAALDTLVELATRLTQDETSSAALNGATILNTLASKAPINNPSFTGNVSGITKAMVGLGSVANKDLSYCDNTSDVNKPVSNATWNQLNFKAPANSPYFTGNVRFDGTNSIYGLNKTHVGLDLVANKNLANCDNTSDLNKPVSNATWNVLNTKAPTNNPSFTGTVQGITPAMIGLGNVVNKNLYYVDNTSDLNKPVSIAQQAALDLKANLNSPVFTGNVSGITKAMVGLGSVANRDLGLVDNTSDVNKPVSTAQQAALNLKANTYSPVFTGNVQGITKAMVGLPNVVDKNLANVDNTADVDKPVSTAQAAALKLKANLASPVFTGTVQGITKAMVGLSMVANKDLSNADNTPDMAKPVSVAQQTALNLKADQSTTYTKTETDSRIQAIVGAAPAALDTLVEVAARLASDESAASALTSVVSTKAPINNPSFTGTVSGITSYMVGLGNVNNTSDAAKPVSTAQQAALDLKANVSTLSSYATLANPSFTGNVSGITSTMVGLGNVNNTSDAAKPVSTAQQTALNLKLDITTHTSDLALKAPINNPTFTGTVSGVTKAMVGLTNVENTALSTWAGSTAITTLGAVTTGTFSGTLGAISGASLTSLNASNIASGTLPVARLDATVPLKATLNGVANTISDGIGNLRSVPVNAVSTYSIVAADNGKCVAATGAVTLNANILAVGDSVMVYNNTGSTLTLNLTGITGYISGNATAKTSVTLAIRGMCSIFVFATNSVSVSGDVS